MVCRTVIKSVYFLCYYIYATTKQIGAALNVDVLRFEAKTMEAIVRVRERLVKEKMLYLQ